MEIFAASTKEFWQLVVIALMVDAVILFLLIAIGESKGRREAVKRLQEARTATSQSAPTQVQEVPHVPLVNERDVQKRVAEAGKAYELRVAEDFARRNDVPDEVWKEQKEFIEKKYKELLR